MNPNLKLRFYVRPVLAITFAFLGVYIAGIAVPQGLATVSRVIIFAIAGGAFGVLGFILPELVELLGRAGIAAIAMQIMREFPKEAVNFATGQKKEPQERFGNPIVVDTSVLIDSRILDIARTGFLIGELLVMPSVISELHALSDSSDGLKRARGRRGLDVLQQLKKVNEIKIKILSRDPAGSGVDEKLIVLAKRVKGRVMTTDYNLNKVAKVKSVAVMNVNELSNAVKSKVLPGEELVLDIKNVGKTKDQGVGYLEDGTMVVVEGGAKFKGQSATVKVMKVLQTAAGRIIFSQPRE